jgi:glycosyltransferase involved in cell wall biosynthesis
MARERGWRHIHTHSCADAAHVAMFAHLLSGIPYSLTLHGPLRDYGPNQPEKWRHARFAIVITERLFAEVNRELAGSLPPAVEIAPMGVEMESFVRSRPYQPWRGGPFRIFTCGRLNPCKGHADLIEAVGALVKRGVDAHLEIAGEDEQGGGGYHRALRETIEQFGLGERARLLGAVSENVVREGLENAHVFALASLEEPLGVAIMEAMAMELPVLVTRAGGVPELVDDGVDGLMVAPRAPEELVAALDKLRNDPGLCVEMGERGRRKIAARFDAGRGAEVIARRL